MSVTVRHGDEGRLASVPVVALFDERAKRRAIRRLRIRFGESITEDDVLWVTGLIRKRVVVDLDR